MDAIDLLRKDHQEVTKLFQRHDTTRGGRAPKGLVEKICDELLIHTQLEEEIFYPAVREAGGELAEMVEESLREHARVKEQVQALKGQRGQRREGGEADAGSRVASLQQDVEHHVTEEEGRMFPRVAEAMNESRRTELGERMAARKRELGSEEGWPPRREAAARKPSSTRARRAKAARRGKGTGRRTTATARRSKTGARRGKTAKGRAAKTARKRARGVRRR